MRKQLKGWRDPALLLTSMGIASIGDFIYLVAINLIVYQMTGSATAVAGLWMVGPLTNIITKFWTGSFIEYRSKKKVMTITYIIRAVFICLIPFAPNMVLIYGVLVLLSMAKAFFQPASTTYVALLVPQEKRKRFNSIQSFATSGAFIIGPAIGGGLILLMNVEMTLWLNAVFFLLSALLLFFLPEQKKVDKEAIPRLTLSQVVEDFTVVQKFMVQNKYVSFIYLGFLLVMIFTFAMDTQEVVFTQQVIGLSEMEYSLLISITGIGSVIGAVLLSVFTNFFSLRAMSDHDDGRIYHIRVFLVLPHHRGRLRPPGFLPSLFECGYSDVLSEQCACGRDGQSDECLSVDPKRGPSRLHSGDRDCR
ncbi:MFS transporter [Salimicrobium flavidum]|uniref:Major Facilitator Superfamily protein n=1 Tax=Salimicrobium flavidum TaxID=570947 RepID=A0A1N7JAK1_9BACI|nr:MFS transporter [Salimicrobium flavidum]SIS46307.1 Major Facilitator Superfamily protein [Salimicrobium flavidum]